VLPEHRFDRATAPGNPLTEARWALLRLILGVAQMTGAVVALCLLITMGLDAPIIAAVVITCVLTTVSVLFFGRGGPRGHAADQHIRS
jgi:hypothetical protein